MISRGSLICILVVGGFAAYQTNELRLAELDVVNQRVDWERESGRAVRAAVDEGNRRTAAMQKEVEDARKKNDALQDDLDGAADAGQRLRNELATARARACPKPGDSPTAGGGDAAKATERLLADVQRRLDEAADRIAEYADRTRIAVETCGGAHRSLTP